MRRKGWMLVTPKEISETDSKIREALLSYDRKQRNRGLPSCPCGAEMVEEAPEDGE